MDPTTPLEALVYAGALWFTQVSFIPQPTISLGLSRPYLWPSVLLRQAETPIIWKAGHFLAVPVYLARPADYALIPVWPA